MTDITHINPSNIRAGKAILLDIDGINYERYATVADACKAQTSPSQRVFVDLLAMAPESAATGPIALERLYSLAHLLLSASSVNPLTLTLSDGRQEFSAAMVMAQARTVLDTEPAR